MCVNDMSSIVPVGHSISEFDLVPHAMDDDVLLLGAESATYGVNYQTFRHIVSFDVANGLGLCSMAYENENLYSPISHKHDGMYNGIDIAQYDGNVNLFSINRTFQNRQFSSEHVMGVRYVGELPREPKVGSLKFVYGKPRQLRFPECITNNQFDGWVYVRSSQTTYGTYELQLTKDELVRTKCYSILGNNDPIDPKIVVPPLTGFYRPTPYPITEFNMVQSHCGDQRHSHPDGFVDNISMRLVFDDADSDFLKLHKGGYKNDIKNVSFMHAGSSKQLDEMDNTNLTSTTYSVNLAQVTLTGMTDTCGDDDVEPEPPHNRLLVMVYIGRRTKPYGTV